MKFAVVDLETTGGRPGPDRITEIGIVLLDDDKEEGFYTTLVDPERSIPSFVVNLTGITDEMVNGAPVFRDVAERVSDLLQDRIFVAHNAPFDHKFLAAEFRLAGYPFDVRRLCTVRLARKAFPGYASYSLGKLAQTLDIDSFTHHRALGDARAAASILGKCLQRLGEDGLEAEITGVSAQILFPPGWSRSNIMEIPESPGILWFHGDKGKVLYVTEGGDMRRRAVQVLSNRSRRGPLYTVRQGLRDISWERTGTELIARLRSYAEVILHKPPCNRSSRIPEDPGAPLPDMLIPGVGRDPSEISVLAVLGGKIIGCAYFEECEGLSMEATLQRLLPLKGAERMTSVVRSFMQRGLVKSVPIRHRDDQALEWDSTSLRT